jgi:hypothetical protein
VYDW